MSRHCRVADAVQGEPVATETSHDDLVPADIPDDGDIGELGPEHKVQALGDGANGTLGTVLEVPHELAVLLGKVGDPLDLLDLLGAGVLRTGVVPVLAGPEAVDEGQLLIFVQVFTFHNGLLLFVDGVGVTLLALVPGSGVAVLAAPAVCQPGEDLLFRWGARDIVAGVAAVCFPELFMTAAVSEDGKATRHVVFCLVLVFFRHGIQD